MKWTLWYDGDYDEYGHGERNEVWYYRITKDDPHFVDFSGKYYEDSEPNIVGAVYENWVPEAKWSATFMAVTPTMSEEILGENHLNRIFDEEGNEHEGNKFVNSLGEYRCWGMDCGYEIWSDFANCADAKKWVEDKWEKWKGDPVFIQRCPECGGPLNDDNDKCEHCAYAQRMKDEEMMFRLRDNEKEKQGTIDDIDQLLLQERLLQGRSQHRRRMIKPLKKVKRIKRIGKHIFRKNVSG